MVENAILLPNYGKKFLTKPTFYCIMYEVVRSTKPNPKRKFVGGHKIMFETQKNLLVEELQLNPDDITLESDLANDLGVNSIELADMIMICEDKFGVEIKDEDIFKFVNVGDVVKFLEENATEQ